MVSFMSLLVMFFSSIGGNLMALPPGERDAAYLQCAPEETVVYLEWATRGEGTPGAEGIEGLAGDPEIRDFFRTLKAEILATVSRETSNSSYPVEVTLGQHLPPLIEALLTRSGCLYVSLDGEEDSTDPAGDPDPAAQDGPLAVLKQLNVTLIVNAGDQADDFETHLRALLELIPQTESPAEGLQEFQIELPMPGLSLTAHREGSYFVVGFGDDTVSRAVAGLKGDVKGLGAVERFQTIYGNVAQTRVGMVSWIDLQRLREDAVRAFGFPAQLVVGMLGTVGADKLDALAATTGVDADGQILTRSFVQTGGSTDGILALVAGRVLQPADFAGVPADADFVATYSLDAAKVLDTARTIVSQVDAEAGDNFSAILEQLNRELGFSIEDDFLAAYGQVWTVFDSPSAGGVLLTSATLSLEVQDADKAREVFGKLMGVLRGILPSPNAGRFSRRGVFLEEKEFLGQQIFFINTVGDDVPFAPAFCQTDKALLIAAHPQALKAQLRFLQSKEPGYDTRIKAHLPEDGEVIGYCQYDAHQFVRYLWSIAPYVAQIAFSEFQREGFEMDVFSFPSARAIQPYVKESVSVVLRTEEGILTISRSSLPVSPWDLITPGLMLFGVRAPIAVPAEPAAF